MGSWNPWQRTIWGPASPTPTSSNVSRTLGLGDFRLLHGVCFYWNTGCCGNDFTYISRFSFHWPNSNSLLSPPHVRQRFAPTCDLRTCDRNLVWLWIFVDVGPATRRFGSERNTRTSTANCCGAVPCSHGISYGPAQSGSCSGRSDNVDHLSRNYQPSVRFDGD